MTSRIVLASLACLALAPSAFAAPGKALELPLVFTDGVVLQRDRPMPVWGQARPGCTVQVELDGQRASATAAGDGSWAVTLPAHAAGGPYVLAVEGCGQRQRIADVLVGEVWLASGQSNMEWPVAQTLHAAEDIAAAGDPQLRHFKVPRSWAEAPRTQLEGGQWQAASPETVGAFSAAGYAFAQELRRTLQVPVGIIDSTWGGSSIEAWMSAGMLGLDAAALEAKMRERRAAEEKIEQAVYQRVAAWAPVDPASDAFAAADLDTTGWQPIKVPAAWESQGYDGMNGVAWYRTTFELGAAEAAAGITLGVGQIDDTDTTWVNGKQVGSTVNAYNKPRIYEVPAGLLRAGTNTIAVRVQDDGGGGGIMGSPEEIFVRPQGGATRALGGQWLFRTAQVSVAMLDDKNQDDTLLYNAMLHPLQPYALAGVIWYQGETNASPEGAYRYRDQFRSLVEGWRAGFRTPALPFLWVQLAPFHSGGDQLDAQGRVLDSPWATLRESQSATLALPATGQAVITDAGDSNDIHPRDKHVVGQRLARIALNKVYGQQHIAWTGPVFREAEVRGRELVLHFEHADGALAARGGALAGFELAGADGRFHPAQARIEGDTVVLQARAVRSPASARYGWSDDPKDANLVGRDGLPASPFRTAEW